MTSYSPIDLRNSQHAAAVSYYSDTGHPLILINSEEDDIDIALREHIAQLFQLNYDEFVECCNGSQHTVVNNDPNHYKMKVAFYCDDASFDTAISITGTLKINNNRQCVFFPNLGSIVKISIDDPDFYDD